MHATLELLAQDGLEGLSMDAVAARAGVGKATIYRRWASRAQLVAAALRSVASDLQVPDTGSVRDDLIATLQLFQQATLRSLPESLRPRLIALTLTNPDLLAIFRANVFAPRRAALLQVLERGKARGELRAGLDVELAFTMIHGPMFQLALLGETGVAAGPETPSKLVDTLLEGIAATRSE